ncbi:hypothetical protein E4656_02575 [Natronospirillum operosum]|uniref:DUF4249 family protein n=1 Tax=Natronospirillum operosum TaxID=2759953 RepID=A0A4Z0WJG4_9GAMM|nr:hypothetical protein [Natronospirillum operosum]TGG95325.1 hypothetical protein E4656_02575 [Natronospirillum operosum]
MHPISPVRWLTVLSASIVLIGCASVPLERANPDRLRANIDYRQAPDQILLETELRQGSGSRRVRADSQQFYVRDASGRETPLEEGDRRGDYSLQLNVGDGPYTLVLAGHGEHTLPLGETLILEDPEQVAGSRRSTSDRITVTYENEDQEALMWSFSARCGSDEWEVRRSLERDQDLIEINLQNVKQQLDRAAGATLTGEIPVTITLYRQYRDDPPAPFRYQRVRTQDSLTFTLDTARVGVQVSGSVSFMVSPNASLGIGAQSRPVRRCT